MSDPNAPEIEIKSERALEAMERGICEAVRCGEEATKQLEIGYVEFRHGNTFDLCAGHAERWDEVWREAHEETRTEAADARFDMMKEEALFNDPY